MSGMPDPVLLALGAGSAFLVLILAARFGITEKHTHLPGLYLRLPIFFGWLAGRIIVSSFQVAFTILRPRLKINPAFVPVKMKRSSDLTLTIHANSITLTPGTISADLTSDGAEVHVLRHNPETQSEFQETEKKILFLEGREQQ